MSDERKLALLQQVKVALRSRIIHWMINIRMLYRLVRKNRQHIHQPFLNPDHKAAMFIWHLRHIILAKLKLINFSLSHSPRAISYTATFSPVIFRLCRAVNLVLVKDTSDDQFIRLILCFQELFQEEFFRWRLRCECSEMKKEHGANHAPPRFPRVTSPVKVFLWNVASSANNEACWNSSYAS